MMELCIDQRSSHCVRQLIISWAIYELNRAIDHMLLEKTKLHLIMLSIANVHDARLSLSDTRCIVLGNLKRSAAKRSVTRSITKVSQELCDMPSIFEGDNCDIDLCLTRGGSSSLTKDGSPRNGPPIHHSHNSHGAALRIISCIVRVCKGLKQVFPVVLGA